ncbi:hypothetical protein BBW65_00995 [Helicobacter enhydrae]|uniref:Uncharacterized protein n=1 Tax=Helicobacter enhydrae TaxID=222136 RepID=A0A1B1U3Z7_9HELI|nr:hypothetical protein [Helicobacter enhydrae]ANV97476.1 hypothetical protein BBW65_00995 [Helicobacter enhydrae]
MKAKKVIKTILKTLTPNPILHSLATFFGRHHTSSYTYKQLDLLIPQHILKHINAVSNDTLIQINQNTKGGGKLVFIILI